MIENAYFFDQAELAEGKTAEQDYARRNLYSGPPFGNLDEDLQVLLERYIEERGVNTALALWVPDFIDYKEQKEYVDWLSGKWNPRAVADRSGSVVLTGICRGQELRRCVNSHRGSNIEIVYKYQWWLLMPPVSRASETAFSAIFFY